MYRLACLAFAALTGTALVTETSSTLNFFNYDTALAVNRPLGLYTALTLHMSLGSVTAGSLFWYGLPVGILWFCPAFQNWRVGRLAWLHEERTKFRFPLSLKLALLALALGIGIWQLSLRPLLIIAAIAGATLVSAHYKQPLMRWTDSKPRWIQVGIMMVLAWAPAGIIPCMLLIERWKLPWGWKAAVNAVIQTYPCLALWFLAGHPVQHESLLQHGALYACRGLFGLLPIVCLLRWLLVRHRRRAAGLLIVSSPQSAV
jgi:hypothetical protein